MVYTVGHILYSKLCSRSYIARMPTRLTSVKFKSDCNLETTYFHSTDNCIDLQLIARICVYEQYLFKFLINLYIYS